ncbi:MAG: hypothetical protein WAT12_04660 [Candidatus Nitrotoga sp.]
MRVAIPIQLSPDDDRCLRILFKRERVEASVLMRDRIVLLAAGSMTDNDIAQKLVLTIELRRAGV